MLSSAFTDVCPTSPTPFVMTETSHTFKGLPKPCWLPRNLGSINFDVPSVFEHQSC